MSVTWCIKEKPKNCLSIFEIKRKSFHLSLLEEESTANLRYITILHIRGILHFMFRDLFFTILQRQQLWKQQYTSCHSFWMNTSGSVYGALEGGASKINRPHRCLKVPSNGPLPYCRHPRNLIPSTLWKSSRTYKVGKMQRKKTRKKDILL
jgi:hypothetical protein